MDATPPSRTAWVDNILNGTAEADRVVLSTPDCVLLPDLKWDPATGGAGLYAVAIFRDASLRSLRDVSGDNAPAIARAVAACRAALGAKCAVPPSSIRAFVHYPPSYLRFHVHFVAAGVPCDDACVRARPVDDVLSAVAIDGAFFQKASLTISVGERDELAQAMMKAAAEEEEKGA